MKAREQFEAAFGDYDLCGNDAAFNVFLEGFNAGSKFEQVEADEEHSHYSRNDTRIGNRVYPVEIEE